jgi:hypothetical protein
VQLERERKPQRFEISGVKKLTNPVKQMDGSRSRVCAPGLGSEDASKRLATGRPMGQNTHHGR